MGLLPGNYNNAIGLEIGDGLVKAVYIQSNSKESRLLGFEMQTVNFREGRQGIVNAIKDVVSKLLTKRKKCGINIAVSGESVTVRDIHWPQMAEEDIRKALQFEVERQVTYKSGEIVFDYYSILDKNMLETKTRVILVAAKKDMIENYASLITAAGYESGFIEVDTFSLLNCFYLNGPRVAPEKTIAIINVGMEVTNIDVIKGKVVGLTKDVFVAWSNLIDALPADFELDFENRAALKTLPGGDEIAELCLFILNALTNQLRRTMEFYETQGQDTVEEIYLCGRIVMHKGLDLYLKSQLGLPVTVWDPISNISYDPKSIDAAKLKKNAQMFAICVGLACKRDFDIDLSGKKKKAKQNIVLKKLLQYKFLILSYGFLIFFLLGIWVIMSSQIKLKEQSINKLVKQNQEILAVVHEVEKLQLNKKILTDNVEIIKAILARRIQWGRKLSDIVNSMPKEVWLTEFALRETAPIMAQKETGNIFEHMFVIEQKGRRAKLLLLKGIAYSAEEDKMLRNINELINGLQNSRNFVRDFPKIELLRTYRDVLKDVTVMNFEISCSVKE